jgi:hypothetical protein
MRVFFASERLRPSSRRKLGSQVAAAPHDLHETRAFAGVMEKEKIRIDALRRQERAV